MELADKIQELTAKIQANKGQLGFYKEHLEIMNNQFIQILINTDDEAKSKVLKGRIRTLNEQLQMLS